MIDETKTAEIVVADSRPLALDEIVIKQRSSATKTVNTVELTGKAIAIGDVIDGYRIDSVLGHGGSAVVYAGWDTVRDRKIAFKVLGNAIGNRKQFHRFLREAATVAKLKHPGIIELFAIGQTATQCYIVMELVEGYDLRQWLDSIIDQADLRMVRPAEDIQAQRDDRQQTIDFSDIAVLPEEKLTPDFVDNSVEQIAQQSNHVEKMTKLLLEICTALAHAHENGIIHRDLKPENIMRRSDGQLVIIDFGLARSYADTTLTSHSSLIGTPLYMSPEQLKGQPANAGSDVFSLGIIGYELLSLSIPYEAWSIEQLMNEILHHSAPPVGARNPSIPTVLANIIHRAIEKNPEKRYANAGEMAQDLERYLRGQKVRATSYRYRFDANDLKLSRPKRVALASFMLMLSGGLFGFAFVFQMIAGKFNTQFLFIAAVQLIASYHMRQGSVLSRWSGLGVIGVYLYYVSQLKSPERSSGVDYSQLLLLGGVMILLAIATGYGVFSGRSRKWLREVQRRRSIHRLKRNGSRLTSSHYSQQ